MRFLRVCFHWHTAWQEPEVANSYCALFEREFDCRLAAARAAALVHALQVLLTPKRSRSQAAPSEHCGTLFAHLF
jgi:hypothetical protein